MEAPLRCFQLGDYAWGVVRAELHVADAAGPGAHGVVGCFQGDRFEAGGVVGADGGGDEVEEGGAGGAHAEGALGAYHCGAEVEGVASGAGGGGGRVSKMFDAGK